MEETYMIRTYICKHGNHKVVSKSSFPVNTRTKRQGRIKGNTQLRHQTANEKACVNRLAMIMNCNFTAGDLMLGLDFDAENYSKLQIGDIRKNAEKEIDNFILRVKRILKKSGIIPRYVAVISDMDGDTGEYVRFHAHIVMTADGFTMRERMLYCGDRKITDVWKKGSVEWDALWDQADYTPVARYLLRQVRRTENEAKYKASRNMEKPEIKEEIIYKRKILRAPAGAEIKEQSKYEDGCAVQYIRYVPKKRIVKKHEDNTGEYGL